MPAETTEQAEHRRAQELSQRIVIRAVVKIGVEEIDAALQRYPTDTWALILEALETEHSVRLLAAGRARYPPGWLERQYPDSKEVDPASDELRPDSA